MRSIILLLLAAFSGLAADAVLTNRQTISPASLTSATTTTQAAAVPPAQFALVAAAQPAPARQPPPPLGDRERELLVQQIDTIRHYSHMMLTVICAALAIVFGIAIWNGWSNGRLFELKLQLLRDKMQLLQDKADEALRLISQKLLPEQEARLLAEIQKARHQTDEQLGKKSLQTDANLAELGWELYDSLGYEAARARNWQRAFGEHLRALETALKLGWQPYSHRRISSSLEAMRDCLKNGVIVTAEQKKKFTGFEERMPEVLDIQFREVCELVQRANEPTPPEDAEVGFIPVLPETPPPAQP